jgi:carboxypeptidase PM20D1
MDILINGLIVLVVVILFLVAFMLFRTLTFAHPLEPVDISEAMEVDTDLVAEHLAGALRFPTISVIDGAASGYMNILDLQNYLQKTYPFVHAQLERTHINDYTLLYTWKGSNPDLAPVVFMAHQDVVPVEAEALPNWTHPPFEGVIADGFVWGRGAQDMKEHLIGILEAAERLLEHDFVPERTIYFAFGHDEEIGGKQGAQALVNWFKEQGIRPEAVLDEGGAVVENMLPGIETPVAVVGVSEKGFVTLELTVDADPGHSATPPRETAIGILAKAVAFIEATPSPVRMENATRLFRGLGPILPFSLQFALANQWLFGGLVRGRLEKAPRTNAMIRTTTAPTIFTAGVKENVLPSKATAKINFRLLPGDTIAVLCERVRKIIDDERVKFEPMQYFFSEASSVSRIDVPAYQALVNSIRETFDGLPVAPMLMTAASDARYFHEICDAVYRFTPIQYTPDDLKRVHGNDERVAVESLEKLVQFFEDLMESWGKAL